jgi:hypothetical protein
MSERYKNIETGEIVKIMSENDKFYTLNNSMKIDKQLFAKKYSIINVGGTTGVREEINPDDFLNQRTNIQTSKPKIPNVIQNPIINEGVVSETIDPIDFLNTTPAIDGVDSIKNIDTSRMVDAPNSQTRQIIDRTQEQIAPVQNSNMEEEKKRLLEKYNIQQNQSQGIGSQQIDENNPEAVDTIIKQNQPVVEKQPVNENGLTEYQESFRQQQIELTGTDPYAQKVAKYREQQRKNNIYNTANESIKLNNDSQSTKNENTQPVTQQPVQTENTQTIVQQEPNDPVYSFFKSAKRNHDMKVKLEIDTKIGKPEFIKMMSENLDGDFIKYYAEDILKELLSDVQKIEKIIYDQVYKEIYGKQKVQKEQKNERTIPIVPKDQRSQLNEGVDKEEVIVLLPGKKTKAGKQTFKFINDKGNVVDMLPETAEKKGYKPAKKDLK